MAIASVKVTFNGSTYNLTNSSGNVWTATLTAPGATSWKLSGNKYPVTVAATNTAGTTTTDTSYGVRVKETVKPVITISSPTSGARVISNKHPVVISITDETGGSGVNIGSLVIKVDGTAVSEGITMTSSTASDGSTSGYTVTYTPVNALSDGQHTVTVNCSDNDGNAAETKSTTYTIDTVPPTLNITRPENGLITNTASCTVSGITNDSTSSPVTLTVNGKAVTVDSSGAFMTAVSLSEGENTITIVARDSAGKATTVTRKVTLDTSKPTISSISISPNPANTGASMTITVTVTG